MRDHLGRSLTEAPAPAPYGTWAGLLPSSPNHCWILTDNLRVICIGTSFPPPSAQWPMEVNAKERLLETTW